MGAGPGRTQLVRLHCGFDWLRPGQIGGIDLQLNAARGQACGAQDEAVHTIERVHHPSVRHVALPHLNMARAVL